MRSGCYFFIRDPFTGFPRARIRNPRIAVYPIKVRWEKSHPDEEEDRAGRFSPW